MSPSGRYTLGVDRARGDSIQRYVIFEGSRVIGEYNTRQRAEEALRRLEKDDRRRRGQLVDARRRARANAPGGKKVNYLPVNVLGTEPAKNPDYDLPEGAYLLQVVDYELRDSADGRSRYIAWACTIMQGPGPAQIQYAKRKFTHRISLSERARPFLKQFLLACGLTEDFLAAQGGQVDPNWLVGRQFVADVVQRDGYLNLVRIRGISEWALQTVRTKREARLITSLEALESMATSAAPLSPSPSAEPPPGEEKDKNEACDPLELERFANLEK